MSAKQIIDDLSYIQIMETILAVVLIFRSKQVSKYRALVAFLLMQIFVGLIYFCLFGLADHKEISTYLANKLYFYAYWTSYGVAAMFALLLVYDIYRAAMAPLPGLQRLGLLMFKWASAISLAIAIGVTTAPNALSSRHSLIYAVRQMERSSSILTLCLLLFVCFAILPMGLSFRSRIFGVNLGLGTLCATNMIGAEWIGHTKTIYSAYNIAQGIATCAAYGIFIFYFAVEEPVRKFILLPTTSPFLRWNQVSLALGQDPGYVAVGGVSPDAFAPAELEIMRRATIKMRELEASGVTPEVERQRYPHTYVEESASLPRQS